ncbi:hypothetical protein ACH4F6_05365 [Streptomyces sp. NPDC017936]|uniref:hypothetical protein n=1 Tax=Streptomyces sp. NPDC017936 TaxID=3365016 RepID=UPI00378A3EC3
MATGSEIARIAGVTRAAVSNWRRRREDFPAPVGGRADSPLFGLAEARAWYGRNPYLYAEGDPVNRIDPDGLVSTGFSGEACSYLCIGGGLSFNDDGSIHPSLSVGAGTSGASGGVEASAGDANSGATGEWECSAGYYWAWVSSQGDTAAGAGTGYVSNPMCSAKVKYTW